jgi:hypothetical protein
MRRHLFYLSLICILLTFTALTPQSVLAGGDPTPTPQPIQPPLITGHNTRVTTGSGAESELESSGMAESYPLGIDSPGLIDLAPQDDTAMAGELVQLAVPQRYQDPNDPTCGAAALGMALEFLSLSEDGSVPDSVTLIKDLESSGFLYDTGTGVEELAYLARAYGYRGASPFHGWTLEGLAGQLAAGQPVVVSLGLNGSSQPGHFVTVTGMASDGSWVRYNDPVLGEQTVSAEEFLASWGAQDYSGLTIQKGALAAASDPLLPWMGLLGAVSTLAVLTKYYPLGNNFKKLLSAIQGAMGNPSRKGLGGKLEPVYEWKQVQDGTKLVTDTSKKIPDYGTRWVQQGWKTITDYSKKIYEYGTRMVQQGWKTVKDYGNKIYEYGTRMVQQGWKTVKDYGKKIYEYGTRWVNKGLKKVTSWVKGIWGWFKKTKWVPKMVKEKFVKGWHYATKKVPKMVKETFVKGWHYATKKVPNMIKETFVKGWHYATKKVPKMVKETFVKGWHYATKVVPNFTWKKVQVGWKGVEDVVKENTPTPEPVPTPVVIPTPIPTLTPTPSPPQPPEISIPTETPVPPKEQEVNEPSLWQKITDPIWWQTKIKEIAEGINNQSIYSLSASDKWDINMYSQAGVLAQTTPYNMIYVNQRLKLGDKVKVTGNPGSLFDIDVTSQTATLNVTENLSIFGSANGGTFGVGQKRAGEMGHDYIVDKYSLGWGQYGPTLTYRQEGVDVVLANEEENFNVKNVSYIACETNTLRTEGLVLIGGVVVLVALLGPEIVPLLGLPELAKLIPAFGH